MNVLLNSFHLNGYTLVLRKGMVAEKTIRKVCWFSELTYYITIQNIAFFNYGTIMVFLRHISRASTDTSINWMSCEESVFYRLIIEPNGSAVCHWIIIPKYHAIVFLYLDIFFLARQTKCASA